MRRENVIKTNDRHMHIMPVLHFQLTLWTSLLLTSVPLQPNINAPDNYVLKEISPSFLLDCNCTITQGGFSYPISALLGNETAPSFYSYNFPITSSANTGLELSNALIIFLYEDVNTGIISLFLIADVGNSGTGGTMDFEANCLPATAFVSVQDDAGEFTGAPPLIIGDWSWGGCCTDGGVIEDIGCSNTINLNLLVSSGLDSIVWLTGDIANPTQILLAMSGEAITINCGGGICCPVGLDTEVLVTDATCPDTPDGAIDLHPQDGVPSYLFNWSNGEVTPNLTGLFSGTYHVTVTDAQGCSEEISIVVGTSPGIPPAQTASIQLCSENSMDFFNLTSVNDIVNLGSGFNVLWFMNSNMTGVILNQSNYLSGSSTVYAVVDNGFCLSAPVPVMLDLVLSPTATPASMSACEENNGMATFDITSLSGTISGGSGNVSWYLNPGLTIPVPNPSAFFTIQTTIYATVQNGPCVSQPVEIDLIVNLKPIGDPTSAHLCGDDNNMAYFDLILLEFSISGGNGSIAWYEDSELIFPIFTPDAFLSESTMVFAVIFDGICYSDPIPIDLMVDITPTGNPVTAEMCDDGSGEALFNLSDYDFQVSNGAGGVDWYFDSFLTDDIPNPLSFVTETTVVYAAVDNGTCISGPIPVTLIVQESPVGQTALLETCADSSGQGNFNLTSVDTIVGGPGDNILWFEDVSGFFPISNPGSFTSFSTFVYAQIDNGICLSALTPVELHIINSVTAIPTAGSACDEGSGMAVFNLLNLANQVSNGTGQVNWFLDPMGLMIIPMPDMFLSGDSTIYARVTAGTCISDIVPVTLTVLSSPTAMDMTLTLCGDSSGMTTFDLTTLDTMVSGHTGVVLWYSDMSLTMAVPNPASFITGDTILYAVVTNGSCNTFPVSIDLSVTPMLTAVSVTLEFCITSGDTISIDLSSSESTISDGAGQVNWFLDSAVTMSISSPNSFQASASQTIYANISDGTCSSTTVPINLILLDQPVANAFSIKRCGDSNGQITLDLTSVDAIISGNTGNVNWYADNNQTQPIVNASSFMSGDTILYATVTNGFCVSPIVPVTLEIVDSITATSTLVSLCVPNNQTPVVNLTLWDFTISGGNGTVYWFTDVNGLDTITNPTSYITNGNTLYAMVVADGCMSSIVAIPVTLESALTPMVICDFTSIDSVAMVWASVTPQYELYYTINGIIVGTPWISTMNTFHLGGLSQGDTVTLWVSALYNSICTTPLTASITCITDVCPPQAITFPGLQSIYCRDEPYILLQANPSGGQFSGSGISGDTLYPYLVAGNNVNINYTLTDLATGCIYNHSAPIQISDPLTPPVLLCDSTSLNSVIFAWLGSNATFEYQYSINQGAVSGVVLTSDSGLYINGLQEGDGVTLSLWNVGSSPCGNSDTVAITCNAKACPPATLSIPDPGVLCADDSPIMMSVNIIGLPGNPTITWSGQGITDPSGIFDPSLSTNGMLMVNVEEGGCSYSGSIDLTILENPIASFVVDGVPCLDSTLHIQFNGQADPSSQWNWNFQPANVMPGNGTNDFSLKWDQPGTYSLSLLIDDHGCLSEPFTTSVKIDAPLELPVLICEEEDFYSMVISWEPVTGATQYIVHSSLGTGNISGNTYTLKNLPDDTPVTITVEVVGPTICGTSIASIECRTADYIPPLIFIPDIFSPDGNSVNDVFFIQTNSQITEISVLRIFDRWGDLLFEQLQFPPNDPTYGWEGTFKEKVMNPGVYLYWAEWKTVDGKTEIKTGDVTLIR